MTDMSKSCSTVGCSRPHRARGLCAPCYGRAQRRGELPPATGRWPKRSVEERFWEKVQKSDDCWLWNSAINRDGYGQFYLAGRSVFAHRLAYELLVGPIPDGIVLDHNATCPKRCVNPAHLRLASTKQNSENRAGPQSNCRSGVLGVYRSDFGWHAHVRHHGERFYLGTFATIEAASSAVLAKRLELFTHNQLDRDEA